ncbi:ABC-2 type transporter [Planctomycetes bacterium Pan216]|uniref:Transport permease protein n=1 Tax=Kolteria novifilia TaxID=2527975 RepID=A0A518BD77_9BACT|nr:ABC-2 type transporter [Planctomycetes bacterium Pan216]
MQQYISDIWKLRYFWFSLVQIDLRNRYRRSVLGLGWSLLQPIAFSVVICAVFHTVFHQDIRDFGPFLICGLSCWNFIAAVTLQGSLSFFQGEHYIRQLPTPMAIYPLRTVLAAAVHFLLALGIAIVAAFLLRGLPNPWALFSLLPSVFLLLLLGWAIATLAGLMSLQFMDTQHLAEVGLQLVFYASPIIYPPDLARGRALQWVFSYNPVAIFLSLIREPIMDGTVPSMATYGSAVLIVATMTALAMAALARMEKKVVFYL